MRILWDNKLKNAGFGGFDIDENYPASNIAHVFLQKKCQATGQTGTILATFSTNQSISCMFYDYHNLSAMELRLYNSSDTLLYTHAFTPQAGSGAEYFALVPGVAKLEIDIETVSAFAMVGGIGLGTCLELPAFLTDYDVTYSDRSLVSESDGGQVLTEKLAPFTGYTLNFPDVDLDKWHEIQAMFLAVGVGVPVYLNLYEDDQVSEPVLYARMEPPKKKRYGQGFNITLTFREAR